MNNCMIDFSYRNAQDRGQSPCPAKDTGTVPLSWNMEPVCGTGAADDPQVFDVTIRNDNFKGFCGIMQLEVYAERKNPKFFMPGYMYGRNTGELPNNGRKKFPRIRFGESKLPESEFFMTRADRLAMPISLIYDEGHVYGIAASPYWTVDSKVKSPWMPSDEKSANKRFYQYSGFTCNINKEGNAAAGYTIGYENAPWLFVQSFDVREREPLTEKNGFTLNPGEEISFRIWVYDFSATELTSIYDAFENVYDIFHESPRRIEGMTEKKATKLLSDAIYQNAWLENQKMYTGFVYDKPNGARLNIIGSLSWTNGMAVAGPMLLAGLMLDEDGKVSQAEEFIKNVLDNAINPKSGLFFEHVEDNVWDNHGWWYDGMHIPGHTGYLCGQTVYYMLRAYEAKKRKTGEVEPLYERVLSFAQNIVEIVNKNLNTEYEYPFVMSEDTGAGVEYDSLGSSWCLAATAYYMLITKERKYLDMAIKSEAHYYEKFVSRCECYGGPLDTDKAVDDEGILAYIRAVRFLHELTGEQVYLLHMRDAIAYECSFKLCYNTPVKVPPLSQIGWSSCGGSITSTANPHIHPMSSTIISEMKYYVEKTGDPYVKERIEDTVYWGLQTFNTKEKEYGYGRIGWMSERFCFCEGLLAEKYPDGSPASTWFALMSWAIASIIEGYV